MSSTDENAEKMQKIFRAVQEIDPKVVVVTLMFEDGSAKIVTDQPFIELTTSSQASLEGTIVRGWPGVPR